VIDLLIVRLKQPFSMEKTFVILRLKLTILQIRTAKLIPSASPGVLPSAREALGQFVERQRTLNQTATV